MHSMLLYIIIPLISAMIGWLTNFIAVKMIFRPYRRVKILGISFYGLIPKRKAALAQKIGETVERELISHKDIHAAVNRPEFHDEIIEVVIDKIDAFIFESLGSHTLVRTLLSGSAASAIKDIVREELRRVVPETLEELFEKMESKLDFKEIVQKRIEGYDLRRLETIVYAIAARELKSIEIFGGLLGFLVGCVQVAIIAVSRVW